ncbi:hypothetical protein INT47_009153 [Mucor saturninus]|uniref:Galactose oxidase n=1 Tax=Mucor saturninus TaxID=64648 RepID=A0A8H7RL30_9FUNG|nr:hypothetical protein INT47_009153 [Mucor saturninus]
MYELDVDNLPQGPVADIKKKWNLVTINQSPGVPQDEYRYATQFVPLPDGSLFFDGGYNEDNPLVARNVTYDPKKNIWTVLPGPGYIDDKNGGVYRQIYSAAAVYLPETESIAFYGGRQLNAVLNFTYTGIKPYANLTYEKKSELHPEKTLVESIYGYNYVTEMNLKTRAWTSRKSEPIFVNDFPTLISDQTATYHPGTKAIIFMGGYIKDALLVGMTRPLNYFLTFDTENSLWKTQKTIGLNTPTARVGHTATMLNTGDDIFMYGGVLTPKNDSLEGNLSADYLYTLNLRSYRWSVYDRPPDTIGPRAFHSAVLVNGTSLFIMFGRVKSEKTGLLVPTNDIMVLNVTDLSSLTSFSTFPNPVDLNSSANKTTTGGQSNDQPGDQSKGISGGAIAGIVVGSVAVIAIIALAALYYKKYKDREEMNGRQVNWDDIDGEYREDPPFVTKYSEGSTNMRNTLAPPDVSGKESPSQYTHSNLIKPDVDMETNAKPDFKTN